MARLHPELRRRRRTAERAWAERRWRIDVDEWFDGGGRADAIEGNREIQAVDPTLLDDAELFDHVEAAIENFRRRALRSFSSHGGDLIPTGDYLAACSRWQIDLAMATSLLAGASPASVETARLLAPVARALAAIPTTPGSIDEIRSLGPEVDASITAWLDLHGWRLLFSDDLDTPTLAESPDLVMRALRAAADPPQPVVDPEPVRSMVPAARRAEFDERLAEARYGLRLRDDNVGVGWNWPAGLLRRAVVEAGRRLADRDQIERVEHVLCVQAAQLRPLLLDGRGPSATELTEAWNFREAVEAAGPPLKLGPEPSPPPLSLLPGPLARAGAAITSIIDAMEGDHATTEGTTDGDSTTLSGVGIGDRTYRATARVVTDAADALSTIDDGDVVVVPFTGPAWNSLIPMIGALVVEEGGPLCHAAIVAREYGLPAVVGVTRATTLIPDGAVVEVDPLAEVVRVEPGARS